MSEIIESTIESIEVVRAGTALRVGLASGHRRLVRRIDLARVLGVPDARAPRFAAAAVQGSDVHITYAGGGSERLPAESLVPAAAGPARAELVVEGAGLLLTADGDPGDALGLIAGGAVICGGGRVLWVGPSADVEHAGYDLSGAERIDVAGRLVTPGLVDCHAHPLFAGNRADEFGRRAEGQGYLEIARAGGGIKATIEPTRAAGFEEHVALTSARLARALAAGTTTCEAKSGYDLTADGELRLLAIAQAVDALQPVDLSPTLLGAHILPPEYAGDRQAYVALVAEDMVPRAARDGLATAVDVYCDQNAFTLEETRTMLEAGRRAGLHVRAHVGQFADLGAAELVAALGGLSVDHLEQVSARGIAELAAAGVVAVMLPGACVQLRMAPPPVEALRRAGVALAVASDLNPGTSLCETLPVQMWLATTHYGMTVPETWLGVTRVAARVLGRHDIGVLAPGTRADLVVWDAASPAEIPYCYGANLVQRVIKDGRVVLSHADRAPDTA